MAANNEIGLLAPVAAIAEIAHAKGALFHTDAVQAFGKVPFAVSSGIRSGVAHGSQAMPGPKGVGALYACAAAIRG
jgi:cysteine desulfurase